MSRLSMVRRLCTRLRNLSNRRRGDARLREEIESHIAAQTDAYVREGLTLVEARRQAHLKFGPLESVREGYHAEESLPYLEDVLIDFRYAVRVFVKSPAFVLTAILTLMLAIGSNIFVFGVCNAVLLRPLAISDPENVYQIRNQPWASFKLITTSYPAFTDIRRSNTSFSELAGYNGYSSARMQFGTTTLNAAGYYVTGSYFDLLGVSPARGRFFRATDEQGANTAPYVVLSDSLWRRLFLADPGVLGKVVQINRHPFTVIGVAPAQFHGTEQFVWPDYWLPMVNQEQVEGRNHLEDRSVSSLTVLARLKPGVSLQQATENLNAIAAQLGKEYPESDTGKPLRLIRPGLYGDNGEVIRGFLYSITVLTVFTWLAACANLASLFAAHAEDRSRELATRAALGASRGRLVRQMFTEASLIALAGGCAGLFGANLLFAGLSRWQSPYGRLVVELDARVYLATLCISGVSAFLFGIISARQVWQINPQSAMKGGALHPNRQSRFGLREWLLCGQIAISTLLVTASLVAVRGMVGVWRTPLGFQPQGALLAEMDLSNGSDDGTGEATGRFAIERQEEMIRALKSIPGVVAVGKVNQTPFTGGLRGTPIFRPGTTDFRLQNGAIEPYVFTISPGYLESAATRLLAGRDFSVRDADDLPHVALVNATFSRKLWGKAAAVGQRFIISGHLTEVVGVVEDGKYHDIHEPPQPVVYLPWTQSEQQADIFVVRWRHTENGIAEAVERVIRGRQPNAPISVERWSDSLSGVFFPARTTAVALFIIGSLAAMLAITGVYGMASYNVNRRMKELAIRLALGASKIDLIVEAVGRPVLLLGAGSLAGLPLSVFASRILDQMVYRTKPQEPMILVGTMLTMTFLGLAASLIPALRAVSVDPIKWLRGD